ncbi:MAG: type III-A CRISPR-associated RAMP protein Csm3 [Desulfovibrio sp.]|nr:type III-A CRISPR-associated RAMP protein Csm3 [Desulfovibrio sp.]
MELITIHKISGVILLQSGLHIGAGKDAVEIGGLDNPIVKNPLNNAPYIPGSSLKGKMRSLLEARLMGERPETRKSLEKGKPCQCGKAGCPICVIFGVSGSVSTEGNLGPTRLLVRDSLLAPEDLELFKKGELPMEIKYENSIDRRTGVANPRPLERVPAGVKFAFNLGFRVYKGDKEDLLDWLFKGMRMVELDALGGSGSRGCGEVRFLDIHVDEQLRYENLDGIKIF